MTVTASAPVSSAGDPSQLLVAPPRASPTHNVLVESAPGDWSGHEAIENEEFSFQHTFEETGVYTYYCQPHLALGMKGVVEVV